MNPELQKQVYDKYPQLFKQKDFSIKDLTFIGSCIIII